MRNYDTEALSMIAEMSNCNQDLFNGDFEKFQAIAAKFSKIDKDCFLDKSTVIIQLIRLLDDNSEQDFNMMWVCSQVFEFVFKKKIDIKVFTISFFQGVEKITQSPLWLGELIGSFINNPILTEHFNIVCESVPKLSKSHTDIIVDIFDETLTGYKDDGLLDKFNRLMALKEALLA
ncbi:MAG: hypothetical protein ACK41O_01505 [Runella zeae]